MSEAIDHRACLLAIKWEPILIATPRSDLYYVVRLVLNSGRNDDGLGRGHLDRRQRYTRLSWQAEGGMVAQKEAHQCQIISAQRAQILDNRAND